MNRFIPPKLVLAVLVGLVLVIFCFECAVQAQSEKGRVPAIRITGVDSKKVTGRVDYVNYDTHKVVLYICLSKTGGQWWVKPYSNDPKSDIGGRGKWKVNYRTAPTDKNAKAFIAFLVSEKLKKADIPTVLYGGVPFLPGAKAVSNVKTR
ncbi:MAG: hypothetical protein WC610_02075 [Patescibacteria group bacterium]